MLAGDTPNRGSIQTNARVYPAKEPVPNKNLFQKYVNSKTNHETMKKMDTIGKSIPKPLTNQNGALEVQKRERS